MDTIDFSKLQKGLGYHFKNITLLKEALTHPSLSKRSKNFSYQRCEFLGDRVLGLAIAHFLYETYPKEKEGFLAKQQAYLVAGETLSKVAKDLFLYDFILMSPGEEKTGGRENPSILADVCEAVLGAVYLEAGFPIVYAIIKKFWEPYLDHKFEGYGDDPKSSLQQWAQQRGKPIPNYKVIGSEGPDHAPLFYVELSIEGKEPVKGTGSSKRLAERDAAINFLKYLEENP
jgi:ribonuclease-3